jgi:hypothetical protein
VGNTSTSSTVCQVLVCRLTCLEENYDVDHDETNGCEVPDTSTNNHWSGAASSMAPAAVDCADDQNRATQSGRMPSDLRIHSFTGFLATTGSAPDWYQLHVAAESSPCEGSLQATLDITQSLGTACYGLYVYTGTGASTPLGNCAGSCTVAVPPGSYDPGQPGGVTIYLEVRKLCPAIQLAETMEYNLSVTTQ